MKSKFIAVLQVSFLSLVWTVFGYAQSTVTIPAFVPSPPSPVGGLACPQGDGDPAVQSWLNNASVQVEILVALRDGNGIPIVNYPFEDLTLEIRDYCACNANSGPVTSSFNTNANGETVFYATLYPGSYCLLSSVEVFIGGTPAPGATATVDFGIQFNTVDFNCDGIVDDDDRLAMIPKYAIRDYAADLDQSTTWTPADAMVLAKHTFLPTNHKCP